MKNVRKYFIVFVLVFCSLEVVFAQSKNSDAPWFFIQLTDPQFGMFEKNEGFEKETTLFEKAVVEINRLNPDFVVVTGDFVNDQNSEEQVNEFKCLLSKIKKEIPVYLSPGNHDVGNAPDKQSLRKYKKNYGPDRFAFEHKGTRFIGFNTSIIKGKLVNEEKNQFKWLQKQITIGKNARQIILFCHYPFFNKNVDEPTAYSNIDLEDRKKYLDFFNENNVRFIFTGHHHQNALNSYGNLQLVTTSALGKPLGNDPSGLRIVKISGNKIEHDYFGVNEIPSQIEF